jgi:hypothetical protein
VPAGSRSFVTPRRPVDTLIAGFVTKTRFAHEFGTAVAPARRLTNLVIEIRLKADATGDRP